MDAIWRKDINEQKETMKAIFGKLKHNLIKNAYFMRKRIFSVIFIAFILIYSIYSAMLNRDALKDALGTFRQEAADNPNELQTEVATLQNTMEENIEGRMKYIEYFGAVQKALDKKEINNFAYIKDETGSLHYSAFYQDDENDYFEYAMRVKRLKDYVSQFGTDVLFVVAPSKYVPGQTEFYSEDMPVNDPQVVVDETLFYLNRLGVDTLDLNKYLPNEEVPYEEAFFKTDHHWTIPAAFYATEVLTDTLNEKYGYELDTDQYLTKSQFETKIYRQGMLGSMGRATGKNYSGLDDMVAYYPRFHMNIARTYLEENGQYTNKDGDIIGTLILPEVLENTDIYSDSQYSLYLNGLRSYEKIVNHSNPDGKHIFMIRDSYFSPVISFLTPMCGEIDAMWSLENMDELDIESYIKNNRFDCIIIEMYPYNIGDDAFQFFREDTADGAAEQ